MTTSAPHRDPGAGVDPTAVALEAYAPMPLSMHDAPAAPQPTSHGSAGSADGGDFLVPDRPWPRMDVTGERQHHRLYFLS